MFEIYKAAMGLSRMPGTVYTQALNLPEKTFGRIIKLSAAIQPDDGLTYVQRLFREHAGKKRARNAKHNRGHQHSDGSKDHEQHTNRPGHLMPEKWSTWPLRDRPRVLGDGDGLGEPPSNPVGE